MSRAEEFIQDRTRNCSNEIVGYKSRGVFIPSTYIPWLTPDQARRAVEMEKEELIEKAVDWLSEHLYTARDENDPSKHHVRTVEEMGEYVKQPEFLQLFRQQMEE